MNIFGVISIRYSNMSATEKKIADVILDDPNKAIHCTVTEMAEAAGVSRGSIINFATSLGYKGFNQLKIDIARQPLSDILQDAVTNESETRQLFNNVATLVSTAMQYTIDEMTNEIVQVSDMLMEADQILIFAVAPSSYVAEDICYSLMRIGLPVYFSSEPIVSALKAQNLTENSVLIEISEGGRTITGLEVARIAKSKGAKIISFTSSYDSPLYRTSDIALLAVGKDLSASLDTCVARSLYLVLSGCICTYIASKIGDEVYNNIGRELEAIEKFRESK